MSGKILDSAYVANGGATLATPKFAAVSAASSGDNTIVAAVTGKKIRVLSAVLHAAGTTTVKWKSGTAGADLSGAMSIAINSPYLPPESHYGLFETAAGVLLNLVLGGAVQVSGHITYIEVA